MTTELEEQIRCLIDTAPPITLDEIVYPSRLSRRSGRKIPRLAMSGIAIVAAAAGGLAALYGLRAGDGTHAISVVTAPPATVAPRLPYGPPLSGCKWTGDSWDPSAPPNVKVQGPPQGFWSCPATVAQAEQLMGMRLPTPQVPAGWSVAIQEVSGSGTTWVFNQTWTPDGRPPSNTPNERALEIRIQKHPSQRPAVPDNMTLSNGDQANATLAANPEGIVWTHDGVDYLVGTTGLDPAQVLSIANSLP